jgi:hypothetical protein
VNIDWARVPLAGVMVALLVAGGAAFLRDGASPAAAALLAAAMILTGAWLTIEIVSYERRSRRDDDG